MPRAKSYSNMSQSEVSEALDELQSSVLRHERILQAKPVAAKPATRKAAAAVAPRKKPGPKKGWKTTASAAKPKKVQAKPGPKAASPAKKSGKPRLIDAIQGVIGSGTMNAIDVHGELKKRHWLPSSDDPLGYIRYTLSANKDIFLRIEGQRGYYHLSKSKASKANGVAKPKVPAAAKSSPAMAAAVPPAPESSKKVVAAPVAPKVVAAPPPPPAPVPAPVAVSQPAGEDEDPAAVADEILKGAGIDMTESNQSP
jgi:hypothetical protein